MYYATNVDCQNNMYIHIEDTNDDYGPAASFVEMNETRCELYMYIAPTPIAKLL